MFGRQSRNKSQNENTKFHPMSIYVYQKSFPIIQQFIIEKPWNICSKWNLFNHESPEGDRLL